MIKGIAYEIPFGPIYDDRRRYAVRKTANKLLGIRTDFLKKNVLDVEILDALFNLATEYFDKTIDESKPGWLRDYSNRTTDLIHSYGVAVFHDGYSPTLYRYRYTGPQKAESPYPAKQHEGDPESYFRQFIRNYDCTYKRGFSVVFVVTMPYSIDLEQGNTPKHRALNVLLSMKEPLSELVLKAVPNSVTSSPVYRYVIE